MNKKIIWIMALTSLILLIGCEEYNLRENFRDVDSCDDCTDDESCWMGMNNTYSCELLPKECCDYDIDVYERREYISNDCECFSEQNESYNYSKLHMTFEDKKHMAMIDDHWYCVCEGEYILYHSEFADDWDYRLFDECRPIYEKGCECDRCNSYEKKMNETTEFIWTY